MHGLEGCIGESFYLYAVLSLAFCSQNTVILHPVAAEQKYDWGGGSAALGCILFYL